MSPIESTTTNVLTVSNIIKVGWCKYTYTCSGDQLRSFVTSAPSSTAGVENLSCINDPIIFNYMILLEKGVPCTWKYKEEKEKNFETLFTDKVLVRELYVFWLEDAEERPSTLDNLTSLEGLEVADKGVFTWENFESSATQFDLFIKSIKNLMSRKLIGKDAVPMGEMHLFPKSRQKIYECVLSCKYDIHISSTNLVVKPVIRYQSLRPLTPSDFSKSEEIQVRVLLAPSGIRANLLPYRRCEVDDVFAILNEFRTLFGLELSNLEDDSSIPTLVHVQITHDNITKDFPYPAKGIYVITDSNNSYRCEARDSGMVPEIFSNAIDFSPEQRSKPNKWWPYNDLSKEAIQILKLRNSVDLSAPSPGIDTTMTPSTPGMGNGTSSASSPGHNLGTSRSSKKRPLESKAYPSPPDGIQSNETQLPQPQTEPDDIMPPIDFDYSDFDIDVLSAVTDADFITCDNKGSRTISPTTNYHTPNCLSTANEDSPSVDQSQNSLAKHRQQQIDRDLDFKISEIKPRYCPEDYIPLIFHNDVDMSKYMPGGKFCRATNRKKRKRDFCYTPDYEPAWVLEAKKPKTLEQKEEEFECTTSESDANSTSESSESESESDTESDSESEFEWRKIETGNSHSKHSNNRELGFLNAGRLSMIFNIYVLYERRQLRRLTDCEVCNDTQSELALQFLREQIVGGSYPFGAGIRGEGESTFEFIESRRRILENLSDDLPTSSALPSEQQKITMSLKSVIEEISIKFPRPEEHPQLSVNGPLSAQKYYNLSDTQLKIDNDNNDNNDNNDKDTELNFKVLETPDIIVCADNFLIETSPEIVKYWDKHNLTPYAGKKDIKYFVLYPESDSLAYHVKNFFGELRVQYELHCVLGTHEFGVVPSSDQGIIPIHLKQLNRHETELDRMIRSYKIACEDLGTSLALHTPNFDKTQLVIYLINPFDHLTAHYDIFKCYAKFYMTLEKSLKSVSKSILNNVMPQLIPIEHVVRFGENCIRQFRQRPVLKDLAFSIYTRSKSYRPLFILPKPSVVSVSFQLTKKAPPVRKLVEYKKILHMSYGFSFDGRRLIMIWVDMEGKKLGSYSTPTYENKNQIGIESLYKETWSRTCAFREHTGGYRQIIITKTGVMTQEEKNLWIKITERKVPIFSVNLDTTLDIKPTSDGNSKIRGMVLNHPIPVNDFRPEATGFLVEMNNNETVSNTIQVDLLYNPENDNSKNTEVMWDVLNQFHVLSFMEVTTSRMCLPIHVLMVERCCRVYLGVPA